MTEEVMTAPTEAQAPVTEATSASETERLYANKYKSIDELEKGYLNIQSKMGELGSRLPKAPDEYQFDFAKNEVLQRLKYNMTEDPIFQAMIPVFKENNITQATAENLMNAFIDQAYGGLRTPEEELADLGEGGQEIIDGINKRLGDLLSEEEYKIADGWSRTASEVRVLDKLLRHMTSADADRRIPVEAQNTVGREASGELKIQAMQLKSNPDFYKSPDMRRQYDELTRRAAAIDVKVAQDEQRISLI